jgi:hypothetical protein
LSINGLHYTFHETGFCCRLVSTCIVYVHIRLQNHRCCPPLHTHAVWPQYAKEPFSLPANPTVRLVSAMATDPELPPPHCTFMQCRPQRTRIPRRHCTSCSAVTALNRRQRQDVVTPYLARESPLGAHAATGTPPGPSKRIPSADAGKA